MQDILYVNRLQQEKFASAQEYEVGQLPGLTSGCNCQVLCTQAAKGDFAVTPKTLSKAKKHMAILHPFPRSFELSEAVDTDPRAAYFRQTTNGMYVLMVRSGPLLCIPF